MEAMDLIRVVIFTMAGLAFAGGVVCTLGVIVIASAIKEFKKDKH